MDGEPENDRCYFCGGRLEPKTATIPFVMDGSVAVVKNVPAQVCVQCSEAVMSSAVAKNVDKLLRQIYVLRSQVSVLSYGEPVASAA